MHTVILARDSGLAALVKDRFDRHRTGLTEIVPALDTGPAVGELTRLRPSVVLLVAGRSDEQLLGICRQAARLRAPLVVALERAAASDRVAVLNAGAAALIEPFDVDTIEHCIHRVCPHPPGAKGRARRIVVDAERPVAIASGQTIALTELEAAVLRVLVHRRGPVSRGEIEHRVWGSSTRSRTLDVHLLRLRRKLAASGHRIETVRCVGFRYVEPY
jgi:DNA-binding response OmpR family regulator